MTRHASVSAMGLSVLALLVALTASLSAHMEAVRTLPADASSVSSAPAQVRVWFTQQPSPRISLLRMTGPGGDVELGEVTIDRQDRSIAAAVPGTLVALAALVIAGSDDSM